MSTVGRDLFIWINITLLLAVPVVRGQGENERPLSTGANTVVPDLHVKVAPVHGVPTFVISHDPADGYRTFFRPCFETYVPVQRYFEQFAQAGTRLYCFNASAAACDYGHAQPVWLDENTWDYSGFDERVQRVLAADPDAMIMPRVNLGTPRWWIEKYPEECEVLDHGSILYRHPNRNPTLPKDRAFPSCVSHQWRTDIGEALRRLIRHVQQSEYADHIFGYILTGLDTEEWYHWSSGSDQLAGYSQHMRAAFQDWLRRKYGNVLDLQQAWSRRDLTFEQVEVPSRAERFDLGKSTFRDPATQQNVIDFYLFYNELVPDTIDHFARIAKEATLGRKVVGAFYGFMYEFRGDPEYGHNALAKFNSSPWLDFIYVTASYGNRHFGKGGDYTRSPAHSVRLHDKLWYHDNDVISFMADKMWAGRPQNDGSLNDVATWKENLGYTSTAQQSIWMYRRSFGFALCSGAYESFFDLHGGYYDHPELMAEVHQIHEAADYVMNYDRSSNSEILVVADEASCAYATFRSDLLEASLLTPQLQLVQLGAPADHVLLTDLNRLNTDQYKFVIFLNCYRVTSSDRALIARKLKHSGKHLLWCYAPGYFDEEGRSRETMTDLTEMQLALGDDSELIAPQVSLDSLWSEKTATDRSGAPLGTPRKICRLIHVSDPDAVTLGRLPGTSFVTFARKSMPTWVSLYTITPNLTSAVLRELARDAGVHIFNERNDSFYANQNFVALHANGAGPRTITFPRACSAVNVMTRERVMANGRSFDHNFQNGETLILNWQSRP